ncbi:MAG: serine/threonine-protein kinase [Myxococcota bacterium]
MSGNDGRDPEAEADGEATVLADAETRMMDDPEATAAQRQAAETVLALDPADASDSSGEANAAADGHEATELVTRAASIAEEATVLASSPAVERAHQSDSAENAGPGTSADPEDEASRGPKDTRVLSKLASEEVVAGAGAVAGAQAASLGAVTTGSGKTQAEPQAPLPPPPAAPIDPSRGLMPGTILFGEYEIVNVLGVGGMGEVYRARHRRLDEHRAIKVMHAELSQKKGASEFFYREAKALLAVRHPAVVHCHDLLSDDQGRVYLIMEMIEGIPLSKKMNDGPLSADDVAVLGARVSHGLSAAHRKGVIHRDVSPDNIVLPNGRVREAKIIDFGIAKLLEEGEGTIVDGFKGKLSYASPEQLGFYGGKIDGRSDFYSLGLVLVAAAMGRPMSMGTSVMEAVDARRELGALPDEIPVGLRSAIQPLLALDPKDRPQYVDRLFVVPGGGEPGETESAYAATGGAGAAAATGAATAGKDRGVGFAAGLGAAAILALAVGIGFLTLGGDDDAVPTGDASLTDPTDPAELTPLAAGTVTPSNAPAAEPAPAPTMIEKPPEATALVAKPAPQPRPTPRPRRLTASDRVRIIGLLSNAKLALEDNRLMSPADDNAYDRYRSVLKLDPSNAKAKSGLRTVAVRYVSLADSAIEGGDKGQARTYLDRAKRADSSYGGIRAAEARLSNL